MKKIILIIIALLILGVGYYAISPLFRNVEVNDAVPVSVGAVEEAKEMEEVMFDSTTHLTPEEREDMDKQVMEANKEEKEPMNEEMPDKEMQKEMKEDMEESEETTSVTQGPTSHPVMETFGHPAEGTVRVFDTADGQVIRFEDFKTINGPQLNLYLAKDLEATEYIDLGPIRGTEGNINYTVPEGVDLSEYRYVMHWCVPFGVLFNYADLEG